MKLARRWRGLGKECLNILGLFNSVGVDGEENALHLRELYRMSCTDDALLRDRPRCMPRESLGAAHLQLWRLQCYKRLQARDVSHSPRSITPYVDWYIAKDDPSRAGSGASPKCNWQLPFPLRDWNGGCACRGSSL
jgi:hypothetical protein